MSRKSDQYYFDTFLKCANFAYEASQLLNEVVNDYTPDRVSNLTDKIHEIEHNANHEKHEMTEVLIKAFVTPIEREDIMELAHNIDNMVDRIEDVLMRLYCDNIQTIRPEILPICELLIQNTNEVVELIKDLPKFKKNAEFKEHIVNINTMEGKADVMFIDNMRNLHVHEKDALQVLVWRDIFNCLERCHDACEDVASSVEKIVLKNA
ncbi:MAG: DUF47 family protein [Lactobacillus jensenii]|nr:DUF47 family protein [Lactobacillus jensenii]